MIALVLLALAAPFAHPPHSSAAKLKCVDCHSAPAKFGDRVGYPAVAQCASCHAQIDKNTPIPAKATIKLRDFVYFDHRYHLMNAVRCEDCHGEDATRAEVVKMSFCQPCHVKTRAAARCTTCHENQ